MLFRLFVAFLFAFAFLLGGYYALWHYSTQKMVEALPQNLSHFFGADVVFDKIDRNYSISDITTTIRGLKFKKRDEDGFYYRYDGGDVQIKANILQLNHVELSFPPVQKVIISDNRTEEEVRILSSQMDVNISFMPNEQGGDYYLAVHDLELQKEGQEILASDYIYLTCIGHKLRECSLNTNVIEDVVDNTNARWHIVRDETPIRFWVKPLIDGHDFKSIFTSFVSGLDKKDLSVEILSAYVGKDDFWISLLGALDVQTYDADLKVTSSHQPEVLNALNSNGFMKDMKPHNWYVLISNLEAKGEESVMMDYQLKQKDLVVDGYHAGQISSWGDLVRKLWP